MRWGGIKVKVPGRVGVGSSSLLCTISVLPGMGAWGQLLLRGLETPSRETLYALQYALRSLSIYTLEK